MINEIISTLIYEYGAIGLFLVMILQTLIIQIPSEGVIVFAGALGIDFVKIVIFGGLGLFFGSILAFLIGKYGRKVLISKLLGEKWINLIDRWVEKNGWKGIVLARLIPLIPFDLISYLAGVTSLKLRDYAMATLLGVFPRCIFLALVGMSIHEFLSLLEVGIEITFTLGCIGLIVIFYLDQKGYIDVMRMKFVGKLIERIFRI